MLHFSTTYLSVPGTFMHNILYYRKVLSCNKTPPRIFRESLRFLSGAGFFLYSRSVEYQIIFSFFQTGLPVYRAERVLLRLRWMPVVWHRLFSPFWLSALLWLFWMQVLWYLSLCCSFWLCWCWLESWSVSVLGSPVSSCHRLFPDPVSPDLSGFRSSRRLHILPDRHLPAYLRSQFLRFRLPLYSIL